MGRKTLGDAFGGQVTTLEEQRAIWAEAARWEATADARHHNAPWPASQAPDPITLPQLPVR